MPVVRETCIALLRGVNVGGNHKLPMATLTAIVRDVGGEDVATYIQSGNVVYRVARAEVSASGVAIARAIERRCGFPAPVIVRTARELSAVVRANPYATPGVDPKTLHVVFLANAASAAQVAALDAKRSPADALTAVKREIFLHCPNGIGQSKFTNAYFDSVLTTTTTARNWNTVQALLALASGETPVRPARASSRSR